MPQCAKKLSVLCIYTAIQYVKSKFYNEVKRFCNQTDKYLCIYLCIFWIYDLFFSLFHFFFFVLFWNITKWGHQGHFSLFKTNKKPYVVPSEYCSKFKKEWCMCFVKTLMTKGLCCMCWVWAYDVQWSPVIQLKWSTLFVQLEKQREGWVSLSSLWIDCHSAMLGTREISICNLIFFFLDEWCPPSGMNF